jgi:hypothetical protein
MGFEGSGGFVAERRFGVCVRFSYSCTPNTEVLLPFRPFDYPFSTCSMTTPKGGMLSVDKLVANIKALKTSPAIMVATVGGWPADPTTARFQVVDNPAPAGGSGTYLAPVPICTSTAGGAGAAWRLKAFAEGFAGNGLFQTLCAAPLDSTMARIAALVRQVMGS